jgi:asparagine synthase (glutamine-hydrolysing)
VRTCSITFDEAGDETRQAGIVADRFATAHRTRKVAAADFGLIDRLVDAFNEPFADTSVLPTYRLYELAREKVTVALSGDGADEAFAGHRRHGLHAAEERIRRLLPTRLRMGLFARSGEEVYADAVGATGQAARHRLYSAEAKRLLGGHRAEDRYVKAMRDAPARDPIDRAQYADLKIRLPGHILTKVDRTSMAVGLEAREPLLDHRLVEFAARLPVAMRLRRGTGKWLMKRAMRRYLPDEILNRPETGFTPRLSNWFRGPLAMQANAIVHGSALAETGWFDSAALERIAAEHRSGGSDHGRLLWQLVMLDRSLSRLFGLGPVQPYLASTK